MINMTKISDLDLKHDYSIKKDNPQTKTQLHQ